MYFQILSHVHLFDILRFFLIIVGTSTLYKLLDGCAASVRKSMEGLDNYITEGGRAFVELEKLLTELPGDTKDMKERLQQAKQYLKSDLKVSEFLFHFINIIQTFFSLNNNEKLGTVCLMKIYTQKFARS